LHECWLGGCACGPPAILSFLMFHWTEEEVRRRLDPLRVIAAIETAFRDRYPLVRIPARTHIPTRDGVFLVMPCHDRETVGIKFVTVLNSPRDPGQRIQATYMLLDAASAEPRLIIPAGYLTDLRTAATSAVATKLLARADVQTLGLFGTGRQARAHARILPLVRKFRRVVVCGTHPEKTRKFAGEISQALKLPTEPVDARTCAAESDVICTCTTSQTPLFDGSVLRPGTHLNLVGAFQPDSREVDSLTIQRSRIVVDTYDGALTEPGDILVPMREGVIGREAILADLHEMTSGKAVRRNPTDITVFKSVGCALEDLVTAELLSAQ